MVVVGAGLILSNPAVRRYMGQMGIGNVLGNIIPDVERYFKLRSMCVEQRRDIDSAPGKMSAEILAMHYSIEPAKSRFTVQRVCERIAFRLGP